MHADRLGAAVLGILRQIFLQVLVVQKMMKPYQPLYEYKLVGLFCQWDAWEWRVKKAEREKSQGNFRLGRILGFCIEYNMGKDVAGNRL